jgi:hypothetical protein
MEETGARALILQKMAGFGAAIGSLCSTEIKHGTGEGLQPADTIEFIHF